MNVVAESNATRGARRRARTREAILDAAEATFARLGYRGARIEEIALEADVSVGSIYSHFAGKDGLYEALVQRALEQFSTYLRSAYRPWWTPLEQVMACGDAYLRFHVDHPGSFRFIAFDEEVEVSPPVAAGIDALIDEFAAKIQEAIDAGEARALDARLTARFLWGAWNGTVALGLRRDGLALTEEEIQAALQQARDIVLGGLAAPTARDAAGLPLAQLRSTTLRS